MALYVDAIFIHTTTQVIVYTQYQAVTVAAVASDIAGGAEIDGFAFNSDYSKLFIARNNGSGIDGNIYYYDIVVTPTSFTSTFGGVYLNCGVGLGRIWQSQPGGFIVTGVDAGTGAGARACHVADNGTVSGSGGATTLHAGGPAPISWTNDTKLFYAANGVGAAAQVAVPCSGSSVSDYAAVWYGIATTSPSTYALVYDEAVMGCPTADGSPFTWLLGNKTNKFSDSNVYITRANTVKGIVGSTEIQIQAIDWASGIPGATYLSCTQTQKGGATGVPFVDVSSSSGDTEIWFSGPTLNRPIFIQSYLDPTVMYIVTGNETNTQTSLWQNTVPPSNPSTKLLDGISCVQFSRAQCYKYPLVDSGIPPGLIRYSGIAKVPKETVIQDWFTRT